MKTKTMIATLLLAAAGAFAAADTSLVLKPGAAQLKAATAIGNKECPVSREPNGSMGAGKTVIYKGKAVTLCCGSCLKKFAKDPAKYTEIALGNPAKAGPAHDHHDHEGHDHP